ncbi:MAG: UvrD-helicase domain-containing protein, partial [Pseudomonadota bacterium]
MSGGGGQVFPLAGNQRGAVEPRDNVWLSASAGTGKTQVLSARVLRLLLRRDVDPSQILCLTFTKAGAAEMANRINAVLARWVRLEPGKLARELDHLGADIDPETQARARTLFASVLDCPGGGLRIDTIHAFSQWLLGNFPTEADLPPGARPMEDRERELLARDVLADMLSEAERVGDRALLDGVSLFTTRKDPAALRSWLMRCASHAEMWTGPGSWQPPMRPRVLRLLGVPADAGQDWVTQVLNPDMFPDHQLRAMLPILQDWNAKGGRESSAFLERWLSLGLADRAGAVDGFYDTLLTKKGMPRSMATPAKVDPQFPERQLEVAGAVELVAERRALMDLADLLAPALELGRAFALRWEEAKLREGLLDFDDLIRKAAELLKGSIAADWIRYKLDRRF